MPMHLVQNCYPRSLLSGDHCQEIGELTEKMISKYLSHHLFH